MEEVDFLHRAWRCLLFGVVVLFSELSVSGHGLMASCGINRQAARYPG